MRQLLDVLQRAWYPDEEHYCMVCGRMAHDLSFVVYETENGRARTNFVRTRKLPACDQCLARMEV